MKYVIDEDVALSKGIDISSLWILLAIKSGIDIPKAIQNLEDNGIINIDMFNRIRITPHYSDICNDIICSSENSVPIDLDLEEFADSIRDVFPQYKKENSPYYWKCNTREVVLSLKMFFKIYGNRYSKDQVLDATRRYVTSFNGSYTYMRLCKYFIYRVDTLIGENGQSYTKETSDLATMLENEGTDVSTEWLHTLC